jgi:uncharacterized protein
LTVYVDTSVFVAALTREPATDRVQQWLADREAGSLAVSGWTRVEFAAALRFKRATDQIDEVTRLAATTEFSRICDTGLIIWPVTGEDFDEAVRVAALDLLGLRAPDALHFSIAWRREAALCTLDDGLIRACNRFGHAYIAP